MSVTLADLHAVIQQVMQWDNKHLHEFSLGDRIFQAQEAESEGEDTAAVRLIDLPLETGSGLRYVYDFGDEWVLSVVVWDRLYGDSSLPACVSGERAAPPEDAGGIHQYEEMLAALVGESSGPDVQELLEWLPPGFDPEAFDMEATNKALRQISFRAI